MLSASKSIFDSPPKQIKEISVGSISKMDVRGMTPPDSDLRNTFATPLTAEGDGSNSSILTHEEAASLNKSLFAEAVMSTPHPGAGGGPPRTAIRFTIGNEDEMARTANRVSVSPLLSEGTTAEVVVKSEDTTTAAEGPTPVPQSSERKSVNFSLSEANKTPTPPKGQFTPFDSGKMVKRLATTPSTAATTDQSGSFWSEMSPVPMSPFESPLPPDLPESAELRRRSSLDRVLDDVVAE